MLPPAKDEYVCFIDTMGIQSTMQHSLNNASNYIFKLHATLLEEWRSYASNTISIYPIMDGAYITSKSKEDILAYLTRVFNSLTCSLLNESQFKYWYFVRASIAYGSIIHGKDIPYDASLEFSTRIGYKESILIGEPIIRAYQTEKNASPMGVFIHESCATSETPIPLDWKWYSSLPSFNKKLVQHRMNQYYECMDICWNEDDYPSEKRQRHLDLFNTYYS